VTSTAPPLSRPPSSLNPRRQSPPEWPGPPNRIHWPIILATVSVSFALVVGVFAWIAAHPHKSAASPKSIGVAIVEPPAIPRAPLVPLQAPVFSTTPVVHHAAWQEKIANNAPRVEVGSPPLPPSASPQPKQDGIDNAEWMASGQLPPIPEQPAGETYGTQVLFLNNQEAAADKARREHKMMFVMHISGNFEDSCFT
jgi:hypothetical protein